MSDKNAKRKSKYESPILVPLGEMAKGSGACGAGSGVDDCNIIVGGMGPYLPGMCGTGNSPVSNCSSSGNNATADSGSYCTAGNTAAEYCSAGNCAALEACTSSGWSAGGQGTGACVTSGFTASAACGTGSAGG